MTSVTGLDGSITRYGYDALGRRTLTAGSSLTTEYEYDEVGSVVRMAMSGDTNVELLYGYDLNGMRMILSIQRGMYSKRKRGT